MSRGLQRVTLIVVLGVATSEVTAATVVVNSVSDSALTNGQVSFREALLSFNAQSDVTADVTSARSGSYGQSDRIDFAIGSGTQTITITSALPAVLQPLEIDGTSQPGFVDEPLITLDGSGAGTPANGLVLAQAIIIRGLDVKGFAGSGIVVGGLQLQDGFENDPAPVWIPDPVLVSQSLVRENADAGIHVAPEANVTLEDVRVLDNAGIGVVVLGALLGTGVEVGFSGSHGVVVESDSPVELSAWDIHHSGGDGTPLVPPDVFAEPESLGPIGLLVLRASHADGFMLAGPGTQVRDNQGHGIQLGHASLQSGIVRAVITESEVHHNQLGIRVLQKNDVDRTYSSIHANNIFQNRSFGMHVRTSYQIPSDVTQLRYYAGNDIHWNSVSGGCTAATGGVQTHAQVMFDGPVGGTDPIVPEPVFPEPGEAGPDRLDYPQDYRCYWGSDEPNLPFDDKTQNPEECAIMNNPEDVYFELSQGVNNRCVWMSGPGQCRVAWDIAGVEGIVGCDSSQNRIFGYLNTPGEHVFTQRGVVATTRAVVRARQNQWGTGGNLEATAVDSGFGSQIDPGSPCPGVVTTCPF